MKLIGITSENEGVEEIGRIIEAIDAGVDYIHLRKPRFNDEELRHYVDCIPSEHLQKITLGSNFSLFHEYPFGGIHTKSRSEGDITVPRSIRTSKSCHNINEVIRFKDKYDYLFLSPIFNSISKKGYDSNFKNADLIEYSIKGYLKNVVALGGVTASNISDLLDINFYGVAVLGYLFGEMSISDFRMRLHKLISIIK